MDAKVDGLALKMSAEMQALKADLIKWMFLFWTGRRSADCC